MSRMFSANGDVVAVTLIAAIPNIVTLRRNTKRDGYTALQLSLPKRTDTRRFVAIREFKGEIEGDAETCSVTQFSPGDIVQVSGISKGKGFAGVVKRHGFKGGPASHGHRHVLRRPGSIGSRFPQHVRKGMRMAGRMGSDHITVKHLQIVAVDEARNLVAIKGAVPGTKGSVVAIYEQ